MDSLIEVKFFDEAICADEKMREVLNLKLRDMKNFLERRIYEERQQQKTLHLQFEKLERAYNSLCSKNDPKMIMHNLYNLESNPYALWKLFQDEIGNVSLFEVFEVQKSEYGINYAQIDKFLAKSQAGNRDYERYKK